MEIPSWDSPNLMLLMELLSRRFIRTRNWLGFVFKIILTNSLSPAVSRPTRHYIVFSVPSSTGNGVDAQREDLVPDPKQAQD